MYKYLKTPGAECLENGNYNIYIAKQHFLKWITAPENSKKYELTE